jgi:uncharacterized protein YndB with AHSA1/START domain
MLASSDERWVAAENLPERNLASAGRSIAVIVDVEVPVAPAVAFAAFADGNRYSGWLGVPVRIQERSFRATLEWGTQVRGTYEVVSSPDLIAMRWDFDDDTVPIPGRELIAYLRVHPTKQGSRVEVHQFADTEEQASFLSGAWAMVLGRFAQAHTAGTVDIDVAVERPVR